MTTLDSLKDDYNEILYFVSSGGPVNIASMMIINALQQTQKRFDVTNESEDETLKSLKEMYNKFLTLKNDLGNIM